MAGNEIVIRVRAEDHASAPIQGVKSRVGEMAAGFATGLIATEALTTGMRFLSSQITSSISAFVESEQVTAKLNAVLKSTGGVAGVSAAEVENLSLSLQRATGVGDEAITSAQTLLLTFTQIGKDIFPQATEAALNLSTVFGQDLQSSAVQVGKALNDPIAGVTALRRVGVQLTEQQEQQIKTFVALGEVEKAQGVILSELETQAGGLARAVGDTAAGKVRIFSEEMDNLKEKIGEALVEGFEPLLDRAVEWAQSDEAVQFTSDLAEVMGDLATATGLAASAIELLGRHSDTFLKNLLPGLSTTLDILRNPEGKLWSGNQPALPNLWPGDTADPGVDAGRGEGNPFAAAAAAANAGGMGSAAAAGGLVADILSRSEEELNKIRLAAGKAQAQLWIDMVAPAMERGSAAAAAVSEAERILADQRNEMASTLLGIQRELQEQQIAAFYKGGEAQLAVVRTSQDAMMEKVRETATELQKRWGMDLPDALSKAMEIVKGSIDAVAESSARLKDSMFELAKQFLGMKFAPGAQAGIQQFFGGGATFGPGGEFGYIGGNARYPSTSGGGGDVEGALAAFRAGAAQANANLIGMLGGQSTYIDVAMP